jgi:hypothetical protein
LPPGDVASPPTSYVIGGDWEARLAAAPANWLTDYHRAVIAHGAGDRRRAAVLYESSLRHQPNAWAERGLAELARAEGRGGDAARHAVDAARAAPGEWRLVAEAVGRLLDDGRPDEALALIDEQPDGVRDRGRMRLLEGFAAVGAGEIARARAVLLAGLEVADLREGERSVDALWRAAFPDRELPPDYDFRMTSSARETGGCRVPATVHDRGGDAGDEGQPVRHQPVGERGERGVGGGETGPDERGRQAGLDEPEPTRRDGDHLEHARGHVGEQQRQRLDPGAAGGDGGHQREVVERPSAHHGDDRPRPA